MPVFSTEHMTQFKTYYCSHNGINSSLSVLQAKNDLITMEKKLQDVQEKRQVVEKVLKEKNAKANHLQEEVYVLKERLANAQGTHKRELETEKQKVSRGSTIEHISWEQCSPMRTVNRDRDELMSSASNYNSQTKSMELNLSERGFHLERSY